MRSFDKLTDLQALIGQEIGTSDWVVVDQKRIDQFADATGDHQWIHVDPVRAAAESPFSSTIAHGFLTLSLISTLVRSAMQFNNLRMAINYGTNRVRFISPVTSGSRTRGRVSPAAAEETGGSVQITWRA